MQEKEKCLACSLDGGGRTGGTERMTHIWQYVKELLQGSRKTGTITSPITNFVTHLKSVFFPLGAPTILTQESQDAIVTRRYHRATSNRTYPNT